MDWNAAVEKNHKALKRILDMLVAMVEIGLRRPLTFLPRTGGSGPDVALAEKSKLSRALTLPRQLHRGVLRLLRPAEAAARRLIIVAARGLVLPPPRPYQPAIPGKTGRPGTPPPRALPLFDRLSPWRVSARPATRGVPRISVPGFSAPFPIAVQRPDDPIDSTRIVARLHALAAALDDLPRQAKRFARWRARVATPSQSPSPPCGEGPRMGVSRQRTSRYTLHVTVRSRRLWPLRPGRPPGWQRKPVHEVHEILDVVHGLAVWALESPDTS